MQDKFYHLHFFRKEFYQKDDLVKLRNSHQLLFVSRIFVEIIKKLRSDNLPTVPTTLEDELNSNIFLRCDQNDLKNKLNMKNYEDFKVFRKVRDLKDNF